MNKVLATNKRLFSFDLARALAIACVVLCHATETIYRLNINGYNSVSTTSKITMVVVFVVGRLGVPIFLFLTGALILRKNIESDEDIVKFYKKNLIPLLAANTIWVLIYNVFFLLNGQADKVTIEAVLKELFLMKTVPVTNMWYFPMIIGMYLGLPFVAKIVKSFSLKSILILASAIFFASFIIPFINILFKIFNINFSIEFVPGLQFLGGAYGLYILLGYYLTNLNRFKRIKILNLIFIALISFIATCAIQVVSFGEASHYSYTIWYNLPLLFICAACIFLIVTRFEYKKLNKNIVKVVTFISKASLAIFFMHVITQTILKPYIVGLSISMPLKLILLFASNFIICTTISYILSRLKYISKWVLRIK